MSIAKLLVDKITEFLEEHAQEKKLVTEEEILRAIDDLPPLPKKETSQKSMDIGFIEKGYDEKDNMVEVPRPKSWSLFKYLGKPEYQGLTNVERDRRLYFTIPCGWEWDDAVKFWFITFPLDGLNDDVVEFFTLMQMV